MGLEQWSGTWVGTKLEKESSSTTAKVAALLLLAKESETAGANVQLADCEW